MVSSHLLCLALQGGEGLLIDSIAIFAHNFIFLPMFRSVATVNADFELSPTYPKRFIMPTSFLQQGGSFPLTEHAAKGIAQPVSRYSGSHQNSPISGSPNLTRFYGPNACIKELASFRSSKRFPIVCWRSPANGLVLMRSSQPMVGFLGTRCSATN